MDTNDNILEINGIQLELDLLDTDVMEKFEFQRDKIIKDMNAKPTFDGCKTEADKMRKLCGIIDSFFDTMFGDNVAVNIFGENGNLGKRIKGFGVLMNFARTQSTDQVQDILSEYAPQRLANREQRRAAQKTGGNAFYQV